MSPRRATLVWITISIAGSGTGFVAGGSFYYRVGRGGLASAAGSSSRPLAASGTVESVKQIGGGRAVERRHEGNSAIP